jgi:GH24 family phage-related lysozyme (muramidase)
MTPSFVCEALIKSFETCVLHAYLPTPDDKPTIGWGTTGSDVALGMKWTQGQADERFAHDLGAFARGVVDAIGDAPTTQGELDALVSLAYNIGLANLRGSTLLRLHRQGDRVGAAAQFARWTRQAGKVLHGLEQRRTAEALLYRGHA